MNTPHRDRPWLEALYRAHRGAVRAYVVRRVSPDEVDDLVSEVFVTAWRSRDAVPEEPLPWLYRTAANHVLHVRRGQARRGRLALRIGMERESAPFDEIDSALDAQAVVHAMLAELPEDDAEILRLHAWEGLEPSDIATVLGCRPNAARVRLHRARRRAENILARLDRDSAPPTPTPVAARCASGSDDTQQGELP